MPVEAIFSMLLPSCLSLKDRDAPWEQNQHYSTETSGLCYPICFVPVSGTASSLLCTAPAAWEAQSKGEHMGQEAHFMVLADRQVATGSTLQRNCERDERAQHIQSFATFPKWVQMGFGTENPLVLECSCFSLEIMYKNWDGKEKHPTENLLKRASRLFCRREKTWTEGPG